MIGLNQGKPYVRLNSREPQGVPYNYKDIVRPSSLSEEQAESIANSTTIINNITSSSLSSFAGFADGTAALPGAFWTSDTDTGIYRIGANNLGASTDGTLRFNWDTTRLQFSSIYRVFLGASASYFSDSRDSLALIRSENLFTTGLVKNASAGNAAGAAWTAINDQLMEMGIGIAGSGLTAGDPCISAGEAIIGLSKYTGVGGATNGMSIHNRCNSYIRFCSNNTERIRLLGGGNLGINTTTARKRVDILDASDTQLRLTYTDNSVYTDFLTNASGYLSITPSGSRVGINAAPSYTFDVSGTDCRVNSGGVSGFWGVYVASPLFSLSCNRSISGTFTDTAKCSSNINLFYTTTSSDISFYTTTTPNSTPSVTMTITGGKNVGIGTADQVARRRLDVLDASNPQLRLTYTDNSVYTDFKTTSLGGLEITAVGGTPSLKVATGVAIGLYGATPVAQATGGQNVTNNVTDTASTNGTIPDITNGTVYATDYTNLRNALYQLARMLKQDHDQLRAMGILT